MDKNSLGVPIAIVISACIIGGAIYLTGKSDGGSIIPGTKNDQASEQTIEPVTSADHIRGNPNAPIMLVEYSDYDCPFCKNFHETMQQIMTDYGQKGSVAWVYRQFPLESLHPNAPKLAAASECIAELGGNDAFWTFSDLVFGERDVNEQTDISKLGGFATSAGVDEGQFNLCFNSGKYDEQIRDDIDAAVAAGGQGTPHTIVLVGDKVVGTIEGAQPYNIVKQNLDSLIEQIEAQS